MERLAHCGRDGSGMLLLLHGEQPAQAQRGVDVATVWVTGYGSATMWHGQRSTARLASAKATRHLAGSHCCLLPLQSGASLHSSAAASSVKKYRVGDAMMVMFRRLHIFLSCAIAAFRYYAVPSCWVESRPRRHHCPKLLKSRGPKSCIVLRLASFIH